MASAKAGAKGAVTLRLTFPGAGRYVVSSTTKARTGRAKKASSLAYATRTSGAVKAAGSKTLTLKAGARAALALRKAKTLRVTITIAFTPTGGTKRTATKAVSVRSGR